MTQKPKGTLTVEIFRSLKFDDFTSNDHTAKIYKEKHRQFGSKRECLDFGIVEISS